MASIEQEDRKYWEDVQAVNKWWQDPRWRYTKRPFTAEQIVAKRGNLKIEYPSGVQSKKLWELVEGRFRVFTPHCLCACVREPSKLLIESRLFVQDKSASFTYGCLEPTMLTQMVKYLDTVYVSGWQSSSTASSTDEPSPDLADYPMVS